MRSHRFLCTLLLVQAFWLTACGESVTPADGGSTGDGATASDGGGNVRTCTRQEDCAGMGQCVGPEGCGVPWTCQSAGRPCTDDAVTYCTCDGREVIGSGTCPPEPFMHRGSCTTGGAVDGGAGPGFDCDQRHVECREAPPVCNDGEFPSVESGCYGPCVPWGACQPIECEPTASMMQCPQGTFCLESTRRCALPPR